MQNYEKWLLTSSYLSVLPSVCQQVTTRLPLEGFLRSLILRCFSKYFPENWSFSRIGQEKRVFSVRTSWHIWSYLAQFFLEWEMFQTIFLAEIKPHILHWITFFWKFSVYEIMWKNIVLWGRPQMTRRSMCVPCWITKAANTLSEYVIIKAFPLQEWQQCRASMLR
jgi:hypothetical protein